MGNKQVKNPEPSTDQVAFVVPMGRFVYADRGGNWNIKSPVNAVSATRHLKSKGRSSQEADLIVRECLMPIAHGLDCAPDKPATFERDGSLLLNTYVRPLLVPTKGNFPRVEIILKWLSRGEPQAIKYILNWLAFKAQHPEKRNHTALVFVGSQGNGKTTLCQIIAAILGPNNTASVLQNDLRSTFNGHFVGKLLVCADETNSSKSTIDASVGAIKAYIAGGALVPVNIKNVPQSYLPNRMSWIFTSNSTTPVRIEGDDRRFSVFENFEPVTSGHKSMFSEIYASGGDFTPAFKKEICAFAYALKKYNVDERLVRSPFENAARVAMVQASLNSEEVFMAEVAEVGIDTLIARHVETLSPKPSPAEWDFGADGLKSEIVYQAYKAFCSSSGFRVVDAARFGTALLRNRLGEVEKRRARKPLADGSRPYLYRGLKRGARISFNASKPTAAKPANLSISGFGKKSPSKRHSR